jgi:hypothetical protein
MKTVAMTAALAGAAIGLTTAPASASTPTATLGFFTGGCTPDRIGLLISGTVDAAAPITRVSVDIWGSDSFFDDHLFGPFIDARAPLGSAYASELCLLPSTLDEDDGEDEIYANVQISGNGKVFNLRTNQISHSF